jgi:hypothetical protein
MGLKDAYLVLYNSACCAGWAYVWYAACTTILDKVANQSPFGDASAQVYAHDDTATMLTYAQSAALLEILHAALGLVRSPVMVTAMQVMSRIVALVALVFSSQAQTQWGAGLMIISWASVEVPRYAFYVTALLTGDATKKTPFPLFWLRYSLFAILYPTGICGELTVFLAASKDQAFVDKFGPLSVTLYSIVLPIVYFFGSPFMIMNMVANRKSAFKKRFAKPPPPARGLCWPVDAKGQRSSTNVNKTIIAAAVGAVNEQKAEAIRSCKAWRFQYVKHLRAMVEEQCQTPESALKIAQAGLDSAYDIFEFVAPDGSATTFREAMAAKNTEQFFTHVIKGEGNKLTKELEIPYKGGILKGDALKKQVQSWVDYGTIEPSAGAAIVKCIEHPEWLDISNRYFVLLGAGSAMGPLLVLMALGANVIAVDLDRPNIWKRLIDIARQSSGTITFPMKMDPSKCKNDEEMFAQAGCNLFTDTPMIRDWLMNVYPGKSLTVGCYAYLDGALHVQVSLAMDAICRDLSEKRKNTSLAYLCTPTDLHLIPKEAHDAMKANYKSYSGKLYCMMMNLLSGGKFLRQNSKKPVSGKGGEYYLVNGISVAQGPNYALAKRMQHWRAITARNKGCIVSSNIAPSTSTVSVVHNRTFAWAYEGMPYFEPFEIFAPETSNAVMSALLFYDLNDSGSWATPNTSLGNPNQLFSHGSFHGGVWRCAYEVDSIGESSVLLYFGRVAKPYMVAAGAVAAAGAAYVYAV